LTKKFSKSLGEAPMLVFGTLLVALLPLTLYLNPNLYAIGLATALSVIGGAVVGVAQGLIAERLMDDKEINSYFTTLGFISIIPTLVLVIIGAIIAQTYTLQTLFLILGIILAAIVMPIYFILVLIIDAEYRKEHRR
jgi:MFS family permease